MNPFSLNEKKKQTRIPERIKIKSKYFGEYEPGVFIASRSKSKTRSPSKDHLNNIPINNFQAAQKTEKLRSQIVQNSPQIITINPQIDKLQNNPNSASLSEYLSARVTQKKKKKQASAIEMIVEWIERKYFEKLTNQKIDKDTSLSLLRQNKLISTKNQGQKFEESLKKLTYNLFILKTLKGSKKLTKIVDPETKNSCDSSNSQSKEHDIDKITFSPLKSVEKAEDFDIYKFKKNSNFQFDKNSMKRSDLSIQSINRSGNKLISNQNFPEKQVISSKKISLEMPTINTLENLDTKNHRVQSQKDVGENSLKIQNKAFFTEMARSATTNQIMNLSSNSLEKNLPEKEKNIQSPLQITLEVEYVFPLEMALGKKLKNETNLCEMDFWPNALFHPEKLSQKINPTEVSTISSTQQKSEQILNEIFQMNDDQQRILAKIGDFSLKLKSIKDENAEEQGNTESIINKIHTNKDSQVSKSRKSLAQNYFNAHLYVEPQTAQTETYEMPLVKAKTNFKVKRVQNEHLLSQKAILNPKSPQKQVFTFSSLSSQANIKTQRPHKKISTQINRMQTNAFVSNCNIFGLCSGQSVKQLQRSNYFTETSISGREKLTNANSKSSKVVSRPKINFNYISPSSKNPSILGNGKESDSSVLFKSQSSSHLKNTGKAPVKIDIQPAMKGKLYEEITGQTQKDSMAIEREMRCENIDSVKERSQSVPIFARPKAILSQNPELKAKPPIQYVQANKDERSHAKNAFVSTGYGPSYWYKSQENVQANGFSQGINSKASSYYFPGIQSNKGGILISQKILNKPKEPEVFRAQNRYLYPIQKSIQMQRSERAKSLCQKIQVTVRRNQC